MVKRCFCYLIGTTFSQIKQWMLSKGKENLPTCVYYDFGKNFDLIYYCPDSLDIRTKMIFSSTFNDLKDMEFTNNKYQCCDSESLDNVEKKYERCEEQ